MFFPRVAVAALILFSTAAAAEAWTKPAWYIAYVAYAETPRLVGKPFDHKDACKAEATKLARTDPRSNAEVTYRCRYFKSVADVKDYLG